MVPVAWVLELRESACVIPPANVPGFHREELVGSVGSIWTKVTGTATGPPARLTDRGWKGPIPLSRSTPDGVSVADPVALSCDPLFVACELYVAVKEFAPAH